MRCQVHRLRLLSKSASKVVAVVGAGHLPGIRENWEKEIDAQEVREALPPPPPLSLSNSSLCMPHQQQNGWCTYAHYLFGMCLCVRVRVPARLWEHRFSLSITVWRTAGHADAGAPAA